jgi:gliding motility-associated-like protein
MKYKILIVITSFLILIYPTANAQLKCVDTFYNSSLYNSAFKYIAHNISTPLFLSDSALLYCTYGYLIKKKKNNSIEWAKKINKLTETKFATADGGVIALFNCQENGPSLGDRGFVKIDKNGSIVWAKKITIQNIESNNYSLIYNTTQGRNRDLLLANLDVQSSINLVVLDSNANAIKLSKKIRLSFLNGEYLTGMNIVSDKRNIYLAVISDKVLQQPRSTSSSLTMMKLDYETGNISMIKRIMVNDQLAITDTLFGDYTLNGRLYSLCNFAVVGGELMLAGRKSVSWPYDNNRFYAISIDTNLILNRSTIFGYPSTISFFYHFNSGTLPNIDAKGNIFFAYLRDSGYFNFNSTKVDYFMIDAQHNMLAQRTQNIRETGLNSDGYRLNAVPFLKSAANGEIIYHTLLSQRDSVLHIVEIAKDLESSGCMGSDSNLLIIEHPGHTILTPPTITSITPFPITLSPYNLISERDTAESRTFCSQYSICDTLKVKGDSNLCLSSGVARFTVFKSPQCVRKVKWSFDTTRIQLVSQPNDTTINLRFTGAFRTYIKASLEGCVLRDSLLVTVSNPQSSLSLGRDTIFCPNKTISLNAGVGFKAYSWQDGSTMSRFIASAPGQYYVTATDSCDNRFSDTILVKPMDVAFDLRYSGSICRADTAFVLANPNLTDYSWIPANRASKTDNIIKFFPDNTTLYQVTAFRLSGCTLTDTLLVSVVDCPEYFFVPTSFTPNGDNLNERFKPLISGKIEHFQFSVYNRFGQLIFSTQNVNDGWSGKTDRESQSANVYAWTCYYKFRNRAPMLKKGSFLLLR